MTEVRSEEAAEYCTALPIETEIVDGRMGEERIIAKALQILERRCAARGAEAIKSPETTANYLRLKLHSLEHEVFGIILLDNRHRVLALEEMFRGTVDGASVFPREVVKEALKHNAAALICYHNHPSGVAEPSQADIQITQRLKDALALVDVRVLDHFIVADGGYTSLAERGQI